MAKLKHSTERRRRACARAASRRRERPAAAVGVPLVEAHLCAGHRRLQGRDARRRLVAREGRCASSCKTGADIDAAQGGRQAGRRARDGEGRQGRRLRPRRLSLSRPRQGAGRCRPRRRPEVLRTMTAWHIERTTNMANARRDRDRERRRARQRVRRQARPHQPRRQGGEGRPALRLRRARRRRRPEGPRRLRPRQGARGAGGDPQGDRGRQAQR